jgi:hypothetical protein
MSHFTVMVFGESPEQQLAPFQENNMGNCPEEYLQYCAWGKDGKQYWFMSEEDFKKSEIKTEDDEDGYYENPNSKWDWYLLGGRWTGYFKLKEQHILDGISGENGLLTNPAKKGYCDQTKKMFIDIDGMLKEAEEKAEKEYDKAMSIINGRDFESWEYIRDSKGFSIDEARKYYHDQDIIKDFSKEFGAFLSIDHFMVAKEKYIESARNSKLTPFAVIKDGKWYEKGEMGWWGCVSNEKNKEEWNVEFMKLFDSLPDDTLVSIFDCHI